jgi:hypothetical protein
MVLGKIYPILASAFTKNITFGSQTTFSSIIGFSIGVIIPQKAAVLHTPR